MRILILSALLCGSLYSQVTQSLVMPPTGSASKGTVTACVSDCRIEVDLHAWSTVADNSSIVSTGNLVFTYLVGNNAFQIYWPQGNNGTGPCAHGPSIIPVSLFTSPAMKLRFQTSVAGNPVLAGGVPKVSVVEMWDSLTGAIAYSKTCVYTTLDPTTPGAGATFGDAGSTVTQSSDFIREYTTLVAAGSQMPVTAPAGVYATGAIFDWKFDNSLLDASGNGFTAVLANTPCVANACFASTNLTYPIQSLVVSHPKTATIPFSGSQATPPWSDWVSLKVGAVNTLDGTNSFSQAASSSAVTYLWSQASGSTVTFSSTSAGQPTITPPSFGTYGLSLQVTDANANTATTTLNLGAVSLDANNVIAPSDSKVKEIFGPQIPFGQNPWGLADERNFYAVNAQQTYQATHYDSGWSTTGQGTIVYPFEGTGNGTGPACTTLNGSILATDTTITVANASCLSLAGLPGEPTWIMVGDQAGVFIGHPTQELIRICSRSGNVLTVCYDGRGLSGNTNRWVGTLGATGWPSGTRVGEMRVQGTGTLFSTDSQRAVCPAGLPGPPGAVIYSTGTVTLTGSGTTVVGSGTAWTTAMVGGFIRVTATHATGTPFIFWAQITARADATHFTINRPAPADVDGTAFSYKVTSPAMYLSLEANVPNGDGTFHIARFLQNGLGCESETAMFADVEHDIGAIASAQSGVGFSYKTLLGLYSTSGTFTSNFYGVGLMARNFYYRSGYAPALTLANSVDEYAVRDPEIGDGLIGGTPLALGGTAIGGMVDLVLNGSTVLTWRNVEAFSNTGEIGSQNCNYSDTRDAGYLTAWTTLGANYDTNPTKQAEYQMALGGLLTRDQGCKRNSANGYAGAEVNSFSNSFVWIPSVALNLTNSSTAVVAGATTLNGGIDAVQTSIVVASSATFPTVTPFVVVSGSEALRVDAVAGTTWTVARGVSSTTAASHSNGASIGTVFTPAMCSGVNTGTIQVTHGLNTATVISGTLTQQFRIYITDTISSPIYVGGYEYSVSGSAVQLAGVWPGASGTFSFTSEALDAGGLQQTGIGIDNTPDNATTNHMLQKAWACTYNSPTSLTLNRSWDDTTGSNYHLSRYTVGTFGQQPFMFGVKTNQVKWASQSGDPTIAAGYAAIKPLMGEWYNSYGYDSLNTRGTFYNSVWGICSDPSVIAAGSFISIHGGDNNVAPGCGLNGVLGTDTARVNSAEGGSAMIQYYLANPSPARKAIVDQFYGAIFGFQPWCDAGVASTCDGTFASNMTDLDLSQYKWPGFFGGMGGFFTNSWPAVRAGGAGTGGSTIGGKSVFGGKVTH